VAISRYADDDEEMIPLGVLIENHRTELLRGKLVLEIAVGPKRARCVKTLDGLLNRLLGGRVASLRSKIRFASPTASRSRRFSAAPARGWISFRTRLPPDILLIIETTDSSLDDDRDNMRPLSAELGVTDRWVVDLEDACLEVHRGAWPDGTYPEEGMLRRGESTEIAALPGLVVAVDELL
jgi:Uma2 family endonuclease